MSRKFERRLAALEQRLKASAAGITEIVVGGGLVPGIAPIASFSGRHWDAAPGEPPEAFRARAKAAAEVERTPFIVLGGLPNVSQVPADPETPADAGTTLLGGAAALRLSTPLVPSPR
jgi:hypothetical protein